jgi:hypothetical protein
MDSVYARASIGPCSMLTAARRRRGRGSVTLATMLDHHTSCRSGVEEWQSQCAAWIQAVVLQPDLYRLHSSDLIHGKRSPVRRIHRLWCILRSTYLLRIDVLSLPRVDSWPEFLNFPPFLLRSLGTRLPTPTLTPLPVTTVTHPQVPSPLPELEHHDWVLTVLEDQTYIASPPAVKPSPSNPWFMFRQLADRWARKRYFG